MKEVISRLEKSLRNFIWDKVNRLTLIVLVGFGVLGFSNFKMSKELQDVKIGVDSISAQVVAPENEKYSTLEKYIYGKYCIILEALGRNDLRRN